MALGRKEGITLGREEGMTLGIDNSTISAIKNIMQSLNISSDQAMEILKVPDEKAVLAFFCKFEFSMIKYSVLWAGMATFWLSCLIVI